jgi:glutamate racemase
MKNRLRSVISLLLLSLFCIHTLYSSPAKVQLSGQEEKLDEFFLKNEVTIVITDSGLGGLSIMADAVERMRESKIFQKVNFVFFNALFSKEGGFNSLKTRKEKIRILDSALKSMKENYNPDLILVGCNTLSVIYDDTSFSEEASIPVIGIVEAGVDLIVQKLETSPESKVVIFGTHTTISEDTHKKLLEENGIPSQRIIVQACPELVNYIEKDYTSDETEMLISAYVAEALHKMKDTQPLPLYVSLNCTHYGYSLDLWIKAFQNSKVKPLGFLNPNSKMIDFLFEPQEQNRFERTEISISVVSMVEIGEEKIESIGKKLGETSPKTRDALSFYELKPGLFKWKEYVISER